MGDIHERLTVRWGIQRWSGWESTSRRALERFTADLVVDDVGAVSACVVLHGLDVVVGFTSGQVPQAGANHAVVKNYSVVGLHWGLYTERRPDLVEECTAEALGDVAAGRTTGKTVLVRKSTDGSIRI